MQPVVRAARAAACAVHSHMISFHQLFDHDVWDHSLYLSLSFQPSCSLLSYILSVENASLNRRKERQTDTFLSGETTHMIQTFSVQNIYTIWPVNMNQAVCWPASSADRNSHFIMTAQTIQLSTFLTGINVQLHTASQSHLHYRVHIDTL